MANKKAETISAEGRSIQRSEFRLLRDSKRSVRDAALKTLKSHIHRDIYFAPKSDAKSELSKAIAEAVKRDAEKSTFTSVKETKQRRRNIIFNTVMKHARNLDS